MTASRDGIVYIAQDWPEETDQEGRPCFIGQLELVNSPTLLEPGPGWATAQLAITWRRSRADIVLVRIGMPGTYFSAGARRHDPLPEWPPITGE